MIYHEALRVPVHKLLASVLGRRCDANEGKGSASNVQAQASPNPSLSRPTLSAPSKLRPGNRCPSYYDVFERTNRNHRLTFKLERSEPTAGGDVVVVAQYWKLEARSSFDVLDCRLHFTDIEECFEPGERCDVILAEDEGRGRKCAVLANQGTNFPELERDADRSIHKLVLILRVRLS